MYSIYTNTCTELCAVKHSGGWACPNLEPFWQGTQESDSDGQSDEGSHAAVWDGWGEGDSHAVLLVTDFDAILLHHRQLLQREGVLWVIDTPHQICACTEIAVKNTRTVMTIGIV